MSVSLHPVSHPLSREYAWIGAVSFEDRCVGSLAMLENIQCSVSLMRILDYPTRALPIREDAEKRGKWLSEILRKGKSLLRKKPDKPRTVHAYRPSGILTELQAIATQSRDRNLGIIIDVTCLTKSHTVALANWLCTSSDASSLDVILAYTRPVEYKGAPTDALQSGNWSEVIFAPCGLDLDPDRRDVCGVVLLGHEGARLRLSLREVRPRVAVVVLAEDYELDPLALACRFANSEILSQFERGEVPAWEIMLSPTCSVEGIYERIASLARSAQEQNQRVVLYPYGPKPHILASSLAAQSNGKGKAWFVYAVPKAYDVDFTRGIGKTWWFKIERGEMRHDDLLG